MSRSSGFADRPLSADQLRDALAAALGIDSSGLALLSGARRRPASTGCGPSRSGCAILDERASIDELTGVLRRGAGLAALEREIDRARRAEGRLVVAFLDVDGLKRVNDEFGHAAGDRLLREVATVLRTRLRSYDLVMRWGGDEFVCALYGAEPEGAERRMDAVADGHRRGHPGSDGELGAGRLEEGETPRR